MRQFSYNSELFHFGVIHSADALLGAPADFHNHVVLRLSNSGARRPEGPGKKKKTGLSVVVVRAGDTRALSVPKDLLACSVKEVIQPQVPLRLPCYDFAPVTALAFGRLVLAVPTRTSGAHSFHGVTGGVYKARERIHRGVADPRLLAIPASCPRVAEDNPN